MTELHEIAKTIMKISNQEEISAFLTELFTENEILTISKRWRILKMLASGATQRDIAKKLQVSLCKVTRGSKIFKDKNSLITKYLRKD